MSAVIQIEKLSKQYYIHSQERDPSHSLKEAVTDTVRKGMTLIFNPGNFQSRASRPTSEAFWALKDIYLEIRQGDRIGIIGRNGAGKSTLLKILSRITEPTRGRVSIKGKVSSLLEVGTGFHPELTGRENIFLNGAVLGMSKNDIKNRFDEIVSFAEVEKFLDSPVKHYSSGMYVRLAFAVAAHLEPDILIVDEVLAVGDAQFQKKSLGKMEEAGKEGRTVLFVSHNMQAISTLTKRCVVLAKGECVYNGSTEQSIKEYLRFNVINKQSYDAPPSKIEPKMTLVRLHTSEPGNVHKNGESLEIIVEISAPSTLENPALSIQVIDSYQRPVLHLWNYGLETPFGRSPGLLRLICRIPKLRLYMGSFTLTVQFSEQFGKKNPQKIEGVCPFEVVKFRDRQGFNWQPNEGTYIEDYEWTTS